MRLHSRSDIGVSAIDFRWLIRLAVSSVLVIFWLVSTAFADTAAKLSDQHDPLPSTVIETFENLPDRNALHRWIGDYDPSLAADLAGSRWHTVDIPLKHVTGDSWLALNVVGFMKDMIVVVANPESGTAKVYFESDLLGDAPLIQNSYWLKLNRDGTQGPTKLFVVREFRSKIFLMRSLELMSASEKESNTSKLEIFTAAILGAILALLAYNSALAVQLKSPLHGFYAAHCLGGALLSVWFVGLAYQASWYDKLAIPPNTAALAVLCCWATMTVIFMIRFLEPRFRKGILVKGLSLCFVALFSIVIASLFLGSSLILVRVFNVLALLLIAQSILLFVLSWRHGSVNVPYLLLALAPGMIILFLRATTDQRGFLLTNGLQIGIVFEMLIMSWGLTERVRRIRDVAVRARESAERSEREAIRSLNEDLERQVLERTRKLQDASRRSEQQAVEMSELAMRETALNEKLRYESDIKDRFFSIISHDLRSPFNALLGMTQLMSSMGDRFEKKRLIDYANDVNEVGNKVFELLQNLLEWSRLQMSSDELQPEIMALVERLGESIDLLKPMARKKDIRLSHSVTGTSVYADNDMLQTIVRNLIANAIKFTPEGGSIELLSDDSGDRMVQITVRDSGVGMSRNQINDIFALDKKTSTTGTAGETGTGLGLPLCKEMIEKNGGRIWVESTLGKGSCFHFTLPAAPNEARHA